MPGEIQLNCFCSKRHVPVLDGPQLVFFLAELLPQAQGSGARLPLNFALVLDRSGSMAGEKLQTLKAAVKKIVDQLDAGDIVSLITFETHTQVLVPARPAGDKAALKRQIDRIEDGGGTNLAPALREALNQVRQHLGPNRTSRIVLLTDGEATDEAAVSQKEADQAGSLGVPLIALGFGQDWNHEFLIDLVRRSLLAAPGSLSGRAYYIPTPSQIEAIFQEVLTSMQVVAQQVQFTLRMVQGMEARRVWQVVPVIKETGADTIQGRAILIPIGELEQGGAAYLAELVLPPRPAGTVRIAQAELTYHLPGRGQQRQAVDLVVEYSHDPALTGQLEERVMSVAEQVQAFKLQTQALSEAELGNASGATRKLRQAVTILLAQGETDLAQQIENAAGHLEQSGSLPDGAKKTIKLASSKTVKLSG